LYLRKTIGRIQLLNFSEQTDRPSHKRPFTALCRSTVERLMVCVICVGLCTA